MLRFCCCQGQDFSFCHLIQTSLPSQLSFGNWVLFFQMESGWSIKLATTSRGEVMNARRKLCVCVFVKCVLYKVQYCGLSKFPGSQRSQMGRYLDKYLTCDLNVCKIGRRYANVSSFTLSVVIFEDF